MGPEWSDPHHRAVEAVALEQRLPGAGAAQDDPLVDQERAGDRERPRGERDDLPFGAGGQRGLDGRRRVLRAIAVCRRVEGGARAAPDGDPTGNSRLPDRPPLRGNDVWTRGERWDADGLRAGRLATAGEPVTTRQRRDEDGADPGLARSHRDTAYPGRCRPRNAAA